MSPHWLGPLSCCAAWVLCEAVNGAGPRAARACTLLTMTAPSTYVLLDPKHRQFADEYLLCGNASEAARRIGTTAKQVGVVGCNMLKRPEVQAYLEQRAQELSQQQEPLQQRVIQELEDMALANIGDLITIDAEGRPQINFSKATAKQLKAVTSVKSKERRSFNGKGEHIATDIEAAFTFADKYRGLELLGKHHGLFKEAEQRVVHDIADRLVNARQRLARYSAAEGSEETD